MNGAAVAFASRPSGVSSALRPSSSPLKVGTTATPDHRELVLLAVGVSGGDGVADAHAEVLGGPEPERDLVRASAAAARPRPRCRASPRRSSTACPSSSRPSTTSGALVDDGHVADERVVEHLALEVLAVTSAISTSYGMAERDGRGDQAVEAGDEHEPGDDAGDPDHRAGDGGADRHGAGAPARLEREPEAEHRRGRAPDAGDPVHHGALPHRRRRLRRARRSAPVRAVAASTPTNTTTRPTTSTVTLTADAGVRLVEVDGSDRLDPRGGEGTDRGEDRGERRRGAGRTAGGRRSAGPRQPQRLLDLAGAGGGGVVPGERLDDRDATDHGRRQREEHQRATEEERGVVHRGLGDRRVEDVDDGELGGLGRERAVADQLLDGGLRTRRSRRRRPSRRTK